MFAVTDVGSSQVFGPPVHICPTLMKMDNREAGEGSARERAAGPGDRAREGAMLGLFCAWEGKKCCRTQTSQTRPFQSHPTTVSQPEGLLGRLLWPPRWNPFHLTAIAATPKRTQRYCSSVPVLSVGNSNPRKPQAAVVVEMGS